VGYLYRLALNPSFNPEDVERVRSRMVQSLNADVDTPDSYLQVLQARIAYRATLTKRSARHR